MTKKFLVLPITEEMLITANFLANQRLIYEFPREGYGKYQNNSHLENIRNGYLGELGFLKLMTDKIREKNISDIEKLNKSYDKKLAKIIFKKIKNEQFAYEAVIGQTDRGYDFKKNNYLIDIKTYGTVYLKKEFDSYKTFNDKKRPINKLNLLIEKEQGQKWTNKNNIIFIQAFIEKNECGELKNIIFAGYHIGLPTLNTNFPRPAYACLVKDLAPMNNLFKLLGLFK
jgi:hypothetical protein